MEEAESQALLYIDSYRNSKMGGGGTSESCRICTFMFSHTTETKSFAAEPDYTIMGLEEIITKIRVLCTHFGVVQIYYLYVLQLIMYCFKFRHHYY